MSGEFLPTLDKKTMSEFDMVFRYLSDHERLLVASMCRDVPAGAPRKNRVGV